MRLLDLLFFEVFFQEKEHSALNGAMDDPCVAFRLRARDSNQEIWGCFLNHFCNKMITFFDAAVDKHCVDLGLGAWIMSGERLFPKPIAQSL